MIRDSPRCWDSHLNSRTKTFSYLSLRHCDSKFQVQEAVIKKSELKIFQRSVACTAGRYNKAISKQNLFKPLCHNSNCNVEPCCYWQNFCLAWLMSFKTHFIFSELKKRLQFKMLKNCQDPSLFKQLSCMSCFNTAESLLIQIYTWINDVLLLLLS